MVFGSDDYKDDKQCALVGSKVFLDSDIRRSNCQPDHGGAPKRMSPFRSI